MATTKSDLAAAIRLKEDALPQLFKADPEPPEPVQPPEEPKEKEREIPDRVGEYFINDDGHLYFKEENKKTKELEPKKLANFKPIPVREILIDDGQEIRRLFEVKGILNGKQPLPPAKIKAQDFGNLSWINENWGIKANVEPGYGMKDRLRHAIQLFAENILEQQVFTHLGWRQVEGEWIYLHAGGSIGGKAQVELEREELNKYVLPDKTENVKETLKTSFDILELADPKITFPLLAMIGLAPLCHAAKEGKGSEPDFVLYLVGKSGSLKSSTAALMMNHFGYFPDTNSLPSSFQDTPAGIEKKGFAAKDTVIVVDDYYPAEQKHDKDRMDKVASMLQAFYGDRKGRSRQNPDMTDKRSYPPRGLAIATGEDIPGGSLSRLARFVLVEFEKGCIDVKLLTELQSKSEEMSNNFVGYINWLAPQMGFLPGIVKDLYYKFLSAAQIDNQHGRVISSVAWLSIGLKMFTDYAREMGEIDKAEQMKILSTGWEAFLENASSQQQEMTISEPTTMFLEAIAEMYGTSKIRTNNVKMENPAMGHGDIVGYHDDEYIYFYPTTIYNKVCEFFKAQGRTFPLNSQQLFKHLDHEGHIFAKTNSKGQRQRTHLKKIENKSSRFLFFKKSSVESTED
ncbi:hypothetical protein MRBLBA21_005020 [Peribacillus frigoritolerans]|uniref:hypothetical protein n=1 Tax=Peribacillus frigoritolerans TaxID=450367 RepID=UPI003433AF5D